MDYTKLKTLRKRKGLSQKQLAEALGVDQSSISKYERGTRTPSVTSLILLVKTLGKDDESEIISDLILGD